MEPLDETFLTSMWQMVRAFFGRHCDSHHADAATNYGVFEASRRPYERWRRNPLDGTELSPPFEVQFFRFARQVARYHYSDLVAYRRDHRDWSDGVDPPDPDPGHAPDLWDGFLEGLRIVSPRSYQLAVVVRVPGMTDRVVAGCWLTAEQTAEMRDAASTSEHELLEFIARTCSNTISVYARRGLEIIRVYMIDRGDAPDWLL